MDKKLQVLIAAGLIVTSIVFFINAYAAVIVLILFIAIIMSLFIMKDTENLPQIDAGLRNDAKAVVIRNTGNAAAEQIHVALVPLDREYDIPALAADASHEYLLDRMMEQVRVVVTYKNNRGNQFSRSFQLSSSGEGFDPLKPMIPMFRWK
jgi:hypothetical protein